MSKPKFTRYRIQEILRSGAGLDLRQARKLTDLIIGAMAAVFLTAFVLTAQVSVFCTNIVFRDYGWGPDMDKVLKP
jgi:hypothetical protein